MSFAAVDPLLDEHIVGQVTTDSATTEAVADGGTTDEECPDCIGAFPCFECYRDGAVFPDE